MDISPYKNKNKNEPDSHSHSHSHSHSNSNSHSEPNPNTSSNNMTSNNLGNLSWFDLAKGYCKYQVGGYPGEMGSRLCGYVEQGMGYMQQADYSVMPKIAAVSSQVKSRHTSTNTSTSISISTSTQLLIEDRFTAECHVSDLNDIPVPYSEYTKNLFDRLEKNKHIEISEEEKTIAELESLSKTYKNNIQYEKEKIATKLDLYTTNLEALNMIIFRAYPPEVTGSENEKLDKLTGLVQTFKSQRSTNNNNGPNEADNMEEEIIYMSLAEELKIDLKRFQDMIAPLSAPDREEHTSMITKVARIIRKLEILTPLLDAYILIFLLRNSSSSERALAYTKEMLAFLSDPLHSSQLRLEPELTRLIEITMLTKLTHLLDNAHLAVEMAISSLNWIVLSHENATPMLHRAVDIRASVLKLHETGEKGGFFQGMDEVRVRVRVSSVRSLQKAFIAARQDLDTSIIRLEQRITSMIDMRKRFRISLAGPLVVATYYFLSGLSEGRGRMI